MGGVLKSNIALVLSAIALLISFASLYFNRLQPGRATGAISYAMIWKFSNLPGGSETDFTFSPVLWITNVGARPLVIGNLRLRLAPEKGNEFKSYPTATIPEKAISSSEFSDYGRLTTGAPFRGTALMPLQKWEPCYKFGIPKERRQDLVGPVRVHVDLKIDGLWQTVCTDTLQFGSAPIHLEPMLGKFRRIPVYTRR
jgi:hypothetical protein